MDQPPNEPATVEALKARRKALGSDLVAAHARLAANPPVNISSNTVYLPWHPGPWLQEYAKATKRWFMAAYRTGTLKRVLYWGLIALCVPLLVILGKNLDIEWTWKYWGAHKFSENGAPEITFDRSAIFRNLGLAALAVIGVILAVWRSLLAHQAHRLSEKGLVIDRYQKGAQMLESEELSVRLSGIYALKELVKSDPAETYIMVLDLLFDFVRERSRDREPDFSKVTREHPKPDYGPFPPDLLKALQIASWLRENIQNSIRLEDRETWRVDLSDANLSGADLRGANLSGADLTGANLSGAKLWNANLSGADLWKANLTGAVLYVANLSGAFFHRANLSGAELLSANLSGAHLVGTNLSDARVEDAILDDAKLWGIWAYENAQPDNMPDEMKDAITYRKPDEDWKDFQKRIEQVRV